MRTPWIGLTLMAIAWGASPINTREEMLEILKGRYNYASFDCAARVLATNAGCRSASAILQSQKDSYLLNLCSYPEKYVILELCQDIRIDTLVTANFEYFSSTVREFRVSVSKKYPAVGWRELGRFVGENTRKEQIFHINQADVYSRYLRIDFDTYYGNEYYCLLSVLRVYGMTMMEVFVEGASALPAAGKKKLITNEPMINDSVASIQATVISSIDVIGDEPTITKISNPTTVAVVEDSFVNEEFQTTVTDLWKLFRQQTCASHTTSPSVEGSSEDAESPPPILPQENVFKAIYDRLQSLERGVTRSSKNVHTELKRLKDDIKYLKDEVGITKLTTDDQRKSFRARLLDYIEEKMDGFIKDTNQSISVTMEEAQGINRLLFWMSIYCFLQITALISVVSVGFALGWFKNNPPPEQPTKSTINGHRRWRSDGASLDQFTEQEQLVPSCPSPSKVDLIATASRPLLLDESEAELIDATFVPSSLSSQSSIDLKPQEQE